CPPTFTFVCVRLHICSLTLCAWFVGCFGQTAKAGAAQFKVDKGGIIHAGIGKMSYSDQKLLENIRSFMVTLSDSKPEGVKGKYFKVRFPTFHLLRGCAPV